MKLFEYTLLDADGYPNTNIMVGESIDSVKEKLESEWDADEYLNLTVNEVKVDGYIIEVYIDHDGTTKLDTEGWNIKVGQVYSSPFQPAHLKIDNIIMSVTCDSNNAIICGSWVSPQDYSKKIMNIETEEFETEFRVWHLNQEYSLEKDVEKEDK